MLQVTEQDGILVVDSRLVAEELGIEHRSFKQTIDDYKARTEEAFGTLRFQNAKLNDVGRPEMYYLLTEDQATFLMTLSRNTEKVVEAKLNLVKAFSAAKQALLAINQQSQTALHQTLLAEVLTKLDTLAIDQNRMNQLQAEKDALNEASEIHPGCKDVLDKELECDYPESLVLTIKQYLEYKQLANVPFENKLRKRAAQYYRMAKQCEPNRNSKNQTVYSGSDILYLDEALKSILDLD